MRRGAERARRPSGGEEGEVSCRGRCGYRPRYAHVVHFNDGAVGYEPKAETDPVGYVRGGTGHDGM